MIVVIPTGKKFPEGTPVLTKLTEQLSVALAVPSSDSPITKPQEPTVFGGVVIETSAGASMVGLSVSVPQLLELTMML